MYLPTRHDAQIVMFWLELIPTSSKPLLHRQLRYLELPRSSVVVFAVQLRHAKAPDSSLYLPNSHAVHGPPSSPVYPGLHRHALTDVLPLTLIELFAHLMHGELPLTAFHSASPHATQGPPLTPEYPAIHKQSVVLVLPEGDMRKLSVSTFLRFRRVFFCYNC